ncbi:MAG: hypothetical protein A2339_05045 [Elusimicrobia bacterium RIFOXYB12_FULL_50_12]|nr:MAG: hypothetical protein A2278_04110 [Elusimicrobia bacterium RIFOXYA12_FULL_49_49]OGS15096.1 MAG: hypothetical protein A2251_00280 [Elusimicrobia bacterium RIFOXYA2_FULL_47_53]OGS27109.1 MAG: hypothetical protein A2339_05045 [Elusimicrobia bacterium RIFOXYB12_FULL_50_12]OGS29716.1 MAG: hypothetical protein A2323_01080 [Elusimicrobia bacterium RIFOXYB2_FULL_46_23]
MSRNKSKSTIITKLVAATAFFLLPYSIFASTLDYSSYFGKGGTTVINDVKRDPAGNIYIVGETDASSGFPVTAGAYDTTFNGLPKDAFAAKISPDNKIIFCTYLGGIAEDSASSLAIDSSGYIYITGRTYSSNFPYTVISLSVPVIRKCDAFITKLSPDGKKLIFSEFFGGAGVDFGNCVAVDRYGCPYVAGYTQGGLKTTSNAIRMKYGGAGDGFITKFSANGQSVLYSTYLGGLSIDSVTSITIKNEKSLTPDPRIDSVPADFLFVTGDTRSTNFPVTYGAYDTNTARISANSCVLGFVGKINLSTYKFSYLTLLGGETSSSKTSISAVAVDAYGNAYVTGTTSAIDYPTTVAAFQKVLSGGIYDAVITKLNPAGSGLIWSGYLGGNGSDTGFSVIVDTSGSACVSGCTTSLNYPVMGSVFQNSNNGASDIFYTKIVPDGSALESSGLLGGSGYESVKVSIAQGKGSQIIIAGRTASTNFPVTENAIQPIFQGGTSNGFISTVDILKPFKVNHSPVALAGHDTFIETDAQQAAVTLDGSRSYDPDQGDTIVSYKWYDRAGNLVANGAKPSVTLTKGIHYLYLVVSDGISDSTEFVEDTERDSCVIVTVSEGVYRINCGAETFDLTDSKGNWWMRDEAFYSLYRWGNIGGTASEYLGTIYNAEDPDLFRTNRAGGTDMHYKIELPNGKYAVKLMMAETYYQAPDQRSFDVSVEGVSVLRNVDLFAWRGFATPYEKTAYIQVNDQCLDIDFPMVHKGAALISAIEVASVDVTENDFLNFVQKKLFWYFWNECDPLTGHIKDKETNWEPSREIKSSIAATGLGLTAITIGASRGWITTSEAYERVKTTLNSFMSGMPNKEGFWFHFIDMHTGERMAYDDGSPCEVSTVDSGIFILGALQAAEYFKSIGYDPDNIYQTADSLYSRMNWKYYTGIGSDYKKQFVNMGWYPENDGYFTGGFWESYCESVLVNLLALGAPNESFRVSTSAWTSMGRDFIDAYGYMHARQAPLFTHQYHNLYFDLRNKDDGYMDYFETAKYATHTNRLACVNDAEQKYEPNAWGVTACFGLDGNYYVYGAPDGFEDGTIAPTAAGTSIMFTPEESLNALRRMYFKYKQWSWGKNGFADSFKINVNAKCPYALGLDNAPIIIGIENYRTGMVWNTSMANPHLSSALSRAGFSTGSARPLVTASSHEGEWENPDPASVMPQKAFDNDTSTRWSSQHGSDPQWLCIDYKTPRTINKVTIRWEAAYARAYKIQTSLDGHTWTDVFSTTDGDGGTDIITFDPAECRYLRVYGTQRANVSWGYSIWEINAESVSENVALHKPANASSYITMPPYYNYVPSYAFDGLTAPAAPGDEGYFWASVPEYHPWISVDLGAPTLINRIVLFWEQNSHASNYSIQVSTDGSFWSAINPDAGGNFEACRAKFVRLYGNETQPVTYSLWEMQVFGFPTDSPLSFTAKAPFIDPEFKLGEVYSFPNPALNSKKPTIHFECGLADRLELKFYDISGSELHSTQIASSPSVIGNKYAYEYTWDTSNIAPGVYIYSVKAEKNGASDIKVLKKLAIVK